MLWFFLSLKSYVYKNKGDYYKNLKTPIFIKLLFNIFLEHRWINW
jgi:hypothetical protein